MVQATAVGRVNSQISLILVIPAFTFFTFLHMFNYELHISSHVQLSASHFFTCAIVSFTFLHMCNCELHISSHCAIIRMVYSLNDIVDGLGFGCWQSELTDFTDFSHSLPSHSSHFFTCAIVNFIFLHMQNCELHISSHVQLNIFMF